MANSLKPPAKRKSLQWKMTLILSVVLIGLMLLVALPMVLISVQLQLREIDRERQATTQAVADSIAVMMQRVATDQAGTVTDPATLRDNLVTTQISTDLNLLVSQLVPQLQAWAGDTLSTPQLIAAEPSLIEVILLATDGTPLAPTAVDADTLATLNARPEFDLALDGVNAQGIDFLDDGRPLLVLAVPVNDAQGTRQVAIARLDVTGYWQYLTNLQVGDSGYLYIINQAGKPLIQPTFAPENGVPLPWQTFAGGNRTYQGLNNGQVSGAVATIDGSPWRVVTEVPLQEANARLMVLLLILGAILMFGLALAITVARLFSRWVLFPIQTLQEGALRINQGDLSHRIHLNRDDELGLLAGIFNQMVGTLQQNINDLRRLSGQLLSAAEDERRLIAHQIHDELGQTLTALKVTVSMAMKRNPDNENLALAQQLATDVQEQARTLSHELRPAMLDDIGLLATLAWYVDRFEQRANLAISLHTDDFYEDGLSAPLITTLYRLLVEALTNVNKHAQAQTVEITLSRSPQHLHLRIADDGLGFDPHNLANSSSLGLAGMRERVNLLGGTFGVESQSQAGTVLTFDIPLTMSDDVN